MNAALLYLGVGLVWVLPVETTKSVIDSPANCARTPPKPFDAKHFSVSLTVSTRSKFKAVCIQSPDDIGPAVTALEKEGFLAIGRQVVFVAHGFMSNSISADWMSCLKDAILKAEDSTAFIVDWGAGAVILDYNQASSNTQLAGALIANVSNAILNTNTFGGDEEKLYLYCVGHSLGAHVCGNAGHLSGKFDRVTGLDPAGPGFDSCPSWSHIRLSARSAKCVDTIHTEGGGNMAIPFVDPVPYLGTLQQWGHVDFYPNGGLADQPLCASFHCSHGAAIHQYVKSISTRFEGVGPCTNTSSLPESCTGKERQAMGYWSSCHRSSGGVKEGAFYAKASAMSQTCAQPQMVPSCLPLGGKIFLYTADGSPVPEVAHKQNFGVYSFYIADNGLI